MKKLLIILSVSAFALSSCENDNMPNPSPNGESQVVTATYPDMTLIGSPYVVLDVTAGNPYVDSGATSYDALNGQTTNAVAFFNNVDVNKEGFYSVKYKAKNAYGYWSFITRVVLVTSVNPATDISGLYVRPANNSPVHITKVARGLYWNDNIAGSTRIRAYMGFINDTTLEVTEQVANTGGEVSCDHITWQMDASDTAYSWIVRAAGFGTGVRSFTHVE